MLVRPIMSKRGILARRVRVIALIFPSRLASRGAVKVSSAVMVFAAPSIKPKSAGDALEAARFNIREKDVRVAYVYCIADEEKEDYTLLGVVSLWDLLIADPAQPLQELMETDLITVQPDTDPRTVAEIMAKYNLLAVPVVNEERVIEGVVMVDDALDVLLPDERRRKPTRMY